MNLQTIKEKMEELAIGNKYMAECCGVTEHYLSQCLTGSKKMTRALEKKIMGVIKSIQITPKSSFTSEVVKENKPSYPSLEELAEWYKQPHEEEKPVEPEVKVVKPIIVTKKEKKDMATQIKELCMNYEQVFGRGYFEQRFRFNKKIVTLKIIVEEDDEE